MADIFTDPNRNYQSPIYTSPRTQSRYRSLRIANHIELAFSLPADHQQYGNRIAVPLLVIHHHDINTSISNSVEDEMDFTFRITFTKPYQIASQLDILLAIFIIMAMLAALFDAYCYKVCQQRTGFDLDIFVQFIISLCGHVAVALFSVASLGAMYMWAISRWQHTLRIILPHTEQQTVFQVFVYVAVPLRSCKLLHQLWRQCTCDVFFIDWERPRVYDPMAKGNHHQQLETPSICSTMTTSKHMVYDGVSAWRIYFVANEWLKLQTQRKSNCWLQLLIIMAAVMVTFNLNIDEQNIFLQFFIQILDIDKNTDATCRFAIGVMLYAGVYLMQRILHFIRVKYVKYSVQQFVDICSMANVSALIWMYESYGFYVHGR